MIITKTIFQLLVLFQILKTENTLCIVFIESGYRNLILLLNLFKVLLNMKERRLFVFIIISDLVQ